jgi:hypothetical protein
MFVAGSVVELIDISSGQHRYIPTVGGFSVGTLVVCQPVLILFSNSTDLLRSGSS